MCQRITTLCANTFSGTTNGNWRKHCWINTDAHSALRRPPWQSRAVCGAMSKSFSKSIRRGAGIERSPNSRRRRAEGA